MGERGGGVDFRVQRGFSVASGVGRLSNNNNNNNNNDTSCVTQLQVETYGKTNCTHT